MNKEQLAERLNGREYGNEISDDEIRLAKESGLVVVHGYSDDNIEFIGAIEEEIGVGEYDEVFLTRGGFFDESGCDCECKYFEAARAAFRENASRIEIFWNSQGYSWVYETEIPHATFDIIEGDDRYCRGIVFSVADLKS